jgi:hypothetical protein
MNHTQQEELEQSVCTRIAPCVTQLLSEAKLPAALCHKPRIGLFAQDGILWDGDGLDVFSQESIGDEAMVRQMLSHEQVIVSRIRVHRRLRHRRESSPRLPGTSSRPCVATLPFSPAKPE